MFHIFGKKNLRNMFKLAIHRSMPNVKTKYFFVMRPEFVASLCLTYFLGVKQVNKTLRLLSRKVFRWSGTILSRSTEMG